MKARRQRASTARLIAILILLGMAIFALYRLFYSVPPAPAPKIVQE